MKSICRFAIAFALTAPAVTSAQTSPRELTIRHIVDVAFNQANVYSAKSPIIERLLGSAKSANPAVSPDAWEKMKPELSIGLTKAMSENGGVFGGALNGAFDELSDSELDRVSQLLDDPVYKKFQTALANPAVQQRVMQLSMASASRMNAALNIVLASHGLREVH